MEIITPRLLLVNEYIPHGHCYLWQMPLVWLHILADGLIAIAYYLIPLSLIYFVRQRQDIPFKNILILFSAFILSCGTTHVMGIWTLWHPDYWISGVIKAITALISLYTALTLVPLIPQAMKLPASFSHLESLNQQLASQIAEKETLAREIKLLNQELEKRVAQRTSTLTLANRDLQKSTQFNEKIADLTPNILYIYDLEKKANIYCNQAIEELLGYMPREIQKYKSNLINELIHPDDVDLVQEHFQKCLELEPDSHLEIEYRIKNRRGKWHWLHDKNTIFERDLNGKPLQLLGVAQDITLKKESELETQELNRQLAKQVKALEIRNQERIKIGEMNTFLQACSTLEEAQMALPDLIKPLFPESHGAIYLMNNSKNLLEAISTWGTINSETAIVPNDCWGLRRGQIHIGKSNSPGIYCSHIHSETDLTPTMCLPMMAQGEILGLFYLRFDNGKITKSCQKLGESAAQNIAMALNNLKLKETLRYQSLRDPLTGLYNRRYLQEALIKEIDRATRKQQFIGIIIVDIDHFKSFNDTYGHEAGDLVLRKVGAYILRQTRQYDIACRYGGEELIIVMPDASLENTILRAEQIREGVKKLKLEHEGKQLEQITVSAGVSCFPDDGTEPQSLIRVADKGLYLAKKQGRDRVVRA